MNNFKQSARRKNKTNFKQNINTKSKQETFDFDFMADFEIDYNFSIERDLLNIDLPKENKGLFFFTDRVRNPNLLIQNIEKKEGIKSLIIFASRIDGCTFLDKTDILISKKRYKENKKYYIHAKILIVNNFVIVSSANLNKTNATIEQHLIINSKCLKNKIQFQLKKK